MSQEGSVLSEEISSKKQGRIDPVRIRQGRKNCPYCYQRMPYRKLGVRVSQWSPGLYGWFCDDHPHVTILDGTIMPNEDHWANKDKERRESVMKRSLGALFKR